MAVNIADEAQVKGSFQAAKIRRSEELDDMRAILKMPQGRRFIWRLLEKSGMFRSIWEQSAKIHFNAGQADLGHFIWAELEEANIEMVFQMMRENKKEELKQND